MSAEEKKESNRKEEAESETKIRLQLDRSKEVDDLRAQLEKISKEAEAKKAEVDKLAKEKADLEQERTNLQTEKEDAFEKLKIISQKEFDAKKTALMEKVHTVFPNPEDEKRIKEIEGKLNDPEHGPQNLKETEYMIGVLDEAFKKTKADLEAKVKVEEEKRKATQAQDANKKAPEGGDTATLTQQQQTGQTGNEKKEGEGFDSTEILIREYRRRARDPRDPIKQAEAQAVLDQLWTKLAKQIKQDFEGRTGQNQFDFEEGKDNKDFEDLQKKLKGAYIVKDGKLVKRDGA